MLKYKLCFRSLETGYQWEGEPVFNTREMAEATQGKLKEETPYIECWVQPVVVGIQKSTKKATED
jgi:hypothetical protein